MKNERKVFENEMRFVMKYIINNSDLPEMTESNKLAIKECVNKKYLDGVFPQTMASGRVVMEITSPKATYEGLKFVYPMIDWKFIIPTVIAILELVVIITTG